MKKRRILAVLLTAVVVLGGCRSRMDLRGTDAGYKSAAENTSYENYSAASAADGLQMDEFTEEAAEMETLPAEDAGKGDSFSSATGRRIVRTGYLRVESTEYEKTLREILDLFGRFDVQIQESGETDRGDLYGDEEKSLRAVSWTIRIPSDRFQEFFDSTGTLSGRIRNKSTSSEDRTREYNSTAVQIESLKIQQENLLEMMKKAVSIKDMLAIEERLSDIRSELQILSGANSQIDYDSDYSRINVELQEVAVYHREEISYLSRLKQAFGDSLIDFAEALGDMSIGLIYAVPYLIISAAAFFAGRRLFLRRKMRPGKKAPENNGGNGEK